MTSIDAAADRDLDQLEAILQEIESQPAETTQARERSAFDELASPLGERLVLFGAGPLGQGVLTGLRKAGVEPLAFADNKHDLWHRQVMGLPVLPPEEAAELHGDSACFVVTIYQGSSARRQLAGLGCQRVVPFAPLLWKFADIFIPQSGLELPHRLREHLHGIRECNAALADEPSKRELREQLIWRYWLDYSVLSPALDAADTYLPMDLLSPSPDEVFVDCGSFDGDSIRSFKSHWGGQFRHVFALEPDPLNRGRLMSDVESMGMSDQVTVLPYAAGAASGQVSFSCTGSVTSHANTDDGESTIECRRLDDIDWPATPTYIKMDIEAAEPDALAGARALLQKHKPALAICTYHRSEHLWQIPNLIHSISPGYRIFLRRYAEECWEGVCYAIPKHRLRTN